MYLSKDIKKIKKCKEKGDLEQKENKRMHNIVFTPNVYFFRCLWKIKGMDEIK